MVCDDTMYNMIIIINASKYYKNSIFYQCMSIKEKVNRLFLIQIICIKNYRFLLKKVSNFLLANIKNNANLLLQIFKIIKCQKSF